MKIGGRVGFNRIEELERNFRSIDFPIELALPYRYTDLWLPIQDRIGEIVEFFKNSNIEIFSIHATQGRVSDDTFMEWGRHTLDLAHQLGVDCITIHPNNVKNQRSMYQDIALSQIQQLGGQNIFSIETFAGKRRLFEPMELVSRKLRMTLDTAHIHDQSQVLEIIRNNHSNITAVHLSAIGHDEHHLPIDSFCVRVVDELVKTKWAGHIVLEYLPWHHYRVRDDINSIVKYAAKGGASGGAVLVPDPPDDKFKDDPEHWGYKSDGSN